MEIKKLDKRTSDKISFIAFIVPEFAAKHQATPVITEFIFGKPFTGIVRSYLKKPCLFVIPTSR
jgi:hypothetical protein